MAALKEIAARTGLSEAEARVYLVMAEERVRLYLAYEEDEDLTRFSSVIADVAVMLYDKNRAAKATQEALLETAGMSGKSYTEGPVSVHETYAGSDGGASVTAAFDTQIKNTLNSIARFRKVRVVKC